MRNGKDSPRRGDVMANQLLFCARGNDIFGSKE